MSIIPRSARSIFEEAVELTSREAREQFLDQACQGNPDLRAKVDALLQAYDDAGDFLEVGPRELPPTAALITERSGSTIGPYKLLQQIGEGGFGVVYMAEQTEPIRRKVALKIIKPGMDTKEVIARFEAERQALAMLEHPYIAKVLDAGSTDTGRPYFVMELIKGVPVTEFCDRNRLTTRQRLEIFVKVCQAIQHAHLKGIVHRDVKPSNVLVSLNGGVPEPKVIDFGVAKAIAQQLTARTMFTAHGQMIGTPQYMSPEQAEMSALDVDTRSDVYSLGVLLYELLTGSTPLSDKSLRGKAYGELQRMIREEEAVRPSLRLSTGGNLSAEVAASRSEGLRELTAALRGELDWIVLKALEKDRDRRYSTAQGFAEDIERFLRHEPVQACPPSWSYAFRKFGQRHRTFLAASGLVLGMLVVTSLFSSVQAIRAHRANAQARSALDHVTRLRDQATLIAQQVALLLIWLKQDKQHFELCAKSLRAADLSDQDDDPLQAAHFVLLHPSPDPEQLNAAVALAHRANVLRDDSWSRSVVGIAQYRLGNYAAAADWLERAVEISAETGHSPRYFAADDTHCRALSRAFLAMNAYRLNDSTTAREFLALAERDLGPIAAFDLQSPFSVRKFDVWLAINEARRVIGVELTSAEMRRAKIVELQQARVPLVLSDSYASLQLAVMQYWLHQDQDHKALCRKMLAKWRASTDPLECDRAAKAYLIRRDAAEDPELLRLAVATAQAARQKGDSPWFTLCCGLASHRNGDNDQAEMYLTESAKAADPEIRTSSLLLRAMVRHRLGRIAEAQSDLSTAQDGIPPAPERTQLSEVLLQHDRLFMWLLHEEATDLLISASDSESK